MAWLGRGFPRFFCGSLFQMCTDTSEQGPGELCPSQTKMKLQQVIAFCHNQAKAVTFSYRHQNLSLLPLEAVPTMHSIVLWSQEYPRRTNHR